jgi:cell division protein FtsL
MIRLGTVFWVGLVALLGFVTFAVTYSVQGLEADLLRVKKQTVVEQREMRVLDAEWTYLTQPGRLEELNQRFLSLSPILPQQLSRTIADIPRRPSEPPAAALVAAAVARNGDRPGPQLRDLVVPTALEPPPAEAGPTVARPAPAKSMAKPMPVRSLDDLFAQVAGER